ncbi:nucleoside deaminase [Vagococcus lutrae]|uniref:nucleoside deaminase n=1 Tax=Vagococcus lutrae TaxID=81947 RepID=UPI002097AA62|nr:nucleoside deaminase [Vagococcus lutrae]MCO7151763.1 nucleoside deaminase [Vagococcus lutrae]MDT2819461.1 nucleoside deaminase [Vagococcus lutrae]MDT2844330.1 nucleoside deaminase [Vagococcus lutrae]WCG04348.1 nucleoside deaminase [Vagococcus lutrae]
MLKNSHRSDLHFMKDALELAKTAAAEGNEPFGALLVKNQHIVATGKNHIHTENDPTYHAELGIIREYCHSSGVTDLSDYTLYTSCEPCCMCAGAIVWANVGRVVYSLSHDELAEIAGFNIMIGSDEVFERSPHVPAVTKNVLKDEAEKIYQEYFGKE